MKDINIVVVSGNLTRDADLKATASGTSVLNFGIAVNGSKKAADGSWEDVPNFFECSIMGARADSLARILHKGMKVTVSGQLRYSSWEKDGQKRSQVSISASDIVLPPASKAAPAPVAESYYADDDIPF